MLLTHFWNQQSLCLFIYLFYCQRKICVMSNGPGDQRWWSAEGRKMWLQLAGFITMSPKLWRINLTASPSTPPFFAGSGESFAIKTEELSSSIALAPLTLFSEIKGSQEQGARFWRRITGNMTKLAFKSFPAVNNSSYIWPCNNLI